MTTGHSTFSQVGARLRSPRGLLRIAAVVMIGIAAALILRAYMTDEEPEFARVAPDHRQQVEANIAFFEGRVQETRDSLSYDRLTSLYLQRLRETGDVSDVRRAESSAMASLNANPGSYSGILNLALVRIAQHDFIEAKRLVEQLVTGAADKPEAYAVLGDAQAALGDYDGASLSYQKFLDLAPGFSAFARQATMAEVRGNAQNAFEFWDDAITVTAFDSPEDSAWARVQLGNTWFAQGKLKDAREQYETALTIYPGLPAAEVGLAKVEFADGEAKRAIDLVSGVTQRIPQADYVLLLGEMKQASGDAAGAEMQYRLLNAIGDLYVSNGVKNDLTVIVYRLDHGSESEIRTALDEAKAAYGERPSVAGADTLAWAYFRNGLFTEAREKSDESLRWGTLDPTLYYHAGMIAKAQGDTVRARQMLMEAMQMNPHFSPLHSIEAKAALETLGGGR